MFQWLFDKVIFTKKLVMKWRDIITYKFVRKLQCLGVKLFLECQTRFLRSGIIFSNWKPFKNNEKCFSFHRKSSFRSQDVYIFVLTFSTWKNDLINKVKLNFKIYDVKKLETNNYNTHITPSDNKIWSVNRI